LADTAVGPTGGHGGPPHHGSSQPLPFDERERIDDFRARVGATLDDYDELRLCELELEHLGLLVRRHPLTLYQHLVSGVVSARDLPRHAGKWVRLLGWCIATKRVDLTRRQAVRDTLELLAEHADMPEPSETDGSFEEEREGAAEDLGIVLRNPRGTGGPRAADRSTENNGGRGDPPHQFQGTGGVSPPTDQRRDAAATPEEFAPSRRAMKFMSMEDLTGTFEVTLFAEAYARFAALTRHAGPFLVTGRVEEQFDTYTVNATELRLLRLDDDGSALAPPSPARSQSIRSAGRAKGGG
jgi:DNA polymerase III alpha subunit